MIAHVCGLKPKEFVHTFGDLHIYENHLEQVEMQLQREPLKLPYLTLDASIDHIDDFKFEHIQLHDYTSHPTIKGKVAI